MSRSMHELLAPFQAHVRHEVTPENALQWLSEQPQTENGDVDYCSMLSTFASSLTQEEAMDVVYFLGMVSP